VQRAARPGSRAMGPHPFPSDNRTKSSHEDGLTDCSSAMALILSLGKPTTKKINTENVFLGALLVFFLKGKKDF
jgi:hypothetical protein